MQRCHQQEAHCSSNAAGTNRESRPEIIMQLRTPFCGNLLRPLLPEQPSDEEIRSLLRTCWSEDPDLRPPFGCIRRHLRETSQDR